jgi:hypothetical protein
LSNYRFQRAVERAIAGFAAVLLFFAGYAVKTVATASAQEPHPASTGIFDGDPSGHTLVPNDAMLSPAQKADLGEHLRALAGLRLAIRYVTALPPHDRLLFAPPKCAAQPCASFVWKNMELTAKYADGEVHGPRTVDVFGTISLK